MLDGRLVRRARSVRALLAADVVLGVVAALLVLAQAVLLAQVAARGFEGASLDELARSDAAVVSGDARSRLERARRIGHDLRLVPPRRIPLPDPLTMVYPPAP